MTRRRFIAALAVPAAQPRARDRVSVEVFLRSPGKGTATIAETWYTERSGGALLSIESRFSRSDTVDAAWRRTSADNGRTWSAAVESHGGEKRQDGMLRRHPRTGVVDPKTGKFVEFRIEGILPTDNPLEGMMQWNIHYRYDGADHQLIHEGAEFDSRHPLPGVYTGRNAVMLGDVASVPLVMNDGSVLLPAIVTTLGSDGRIYNPTGGYTYTSAIVLHGRPRNGRLVWKASDVVPGDPARSTRGMDEPTLAALPDGRLMMVMRGSNAGRPELPGCKWISFSHDGGFRWSPPQPWTFHDGTPFFSPSASSQLLRHSNGRLYWVGHVSASNPRGNSPRYPVYLGEVDTHTGLLIRNSLLQLDDRRPGEDEILMLYCPYAREDRETREIAVHFSRLFAFKDGWVGDAMLHRVSPAA